MIQITYSEKNGYILEVAKTIAIDPEKIIKVTEADSLATIVVANANPKVKPATYKLNITKANVLLMITGSVITFTQKYENGTTGSTSIQTKYIQSMKQLATRIAGVADATDTEIVYSNGGFGDEKVYANEVINSLIYSNAAAFLTYDSGVALDVVVIDAIAHTVAVTVPNGTIITALQPTFTTSANITSIKIGATAQVSGVTANNFTAAKTYRITAQDTLTYIDWVVTVTVAPA